MILCDPWADTLLHNYKLEELEELTWSQSIYWWWQVQSQKPEPSPQPSKNLQGKQIRMSGLDTAHWQFAIPPEDRLQDEWTPIQWIWYTQFNNQQNKYWTNNLKHVLYQAQ